MKTILIDGTSMLTTAYYGSAPFRPEGESDEDYYKKLLQTSTGIYTNAVTIMLKTLLHIINIQKPDYMAVAFDSGRTETFRARMYSNYKGTRKATPEPIKQQIQTMETILQTLNIPVFFEKEYEADDIVCSLADKYKSPDNETIIISKDHDYYQLVDDANNVTLWQPQNTVEKAAELNKSLGWNQTDIASLLPKYVKINEAAVHTLMSVYPYQVPDFKGIAGDKSDNIPGIAGVGEKSAASLLMLFDSLEGIYMALGEDEDAFLASCKANKIRNPIKALKANVEAGFLSLELATMSKNAAENIKQEDLKFPDKNMLDANLLAVIDEYEMESIRQYLYF